MVSPIAEKDASAKVIGSGMVAHLKPTLKPEKESPKVPPNSLVSVTEGSLVFQVVLLLKVWS